MVSEDLEEGAFITFLLGLYDARTGALRFVNAGHEPPLVLRRDAPHVEAIETPHGLVLGVQRAASYPEGSCSLAPGDQAGRGICEIELAGETSRAQLRVQYSSTGGRHELQLWVRHVVMLCLREQSPDLGLPDRSLLIGRSNREAEQITFVAPALAAA